MVQWYVWTDNIFPYSFLSALTYVIKNLVSTIPPLGMWIARLVHDPGLVHDDSFLMRTDPCVCTCSSLVSPHPPPLHCFSVFKHIKCISTLNNTRSIIKDYKMFQLSFSFEVITKRCYTGWLHGSLIGCYKNPFQH